MYGTLPKSGIFMFMIEANGIYIALVRCFSVPIQSELRYGKTCTGWKKRLAVFLYHMMLLFGSCAACSLTEYDREKQKIGVCAQ